MLLGSSTTYQATVVPRVWLLDLNKNFRIFQNVTVEEIVTQILDENQISSDDYEFKLESDYQPRRYCTQYGESDFRFISRILEAEGIFYFFEHTEDSHTIVFSDTEVVYSPIDGEDEMSFNYDSNMVAENETIQSFAYNRAICPGKITHTNYNFKRPSLDMKVEEEGETHVVHEIYEYPGDYGLPPEGSPKVQNHLKEVKAFEESAQGSSNCARFIPACTFMISEHSFKDLNKEYCLISVGHSGSQPNVYGEHSGIGGDYTYSNHFIAIPASAVFRPQNTLQKPYVRGLQSAIVTGPPGEEIHTDEYGRIKVQFHWDRKGEKNEKSSCWLRTSQPWSGNGWGMVSLLRVGDEVLVDFINGDPDWPIMVGNVNNAASPALYDLPANKSQSGIKSRSYPKGSPDNFNELRFEDKKGGEEVYLQAEKNFNVLVKNNKTETVYINKAETIGVAKELSIGAGYQVSVGAAMNETVALGKAEEVGLTRFEAVGEHNIIKVGSDYSLDVGDRCTVTADTIITLRCGSSTITLEPQLITINAPLVKINS
jgi:type VI secretion system secreted protein VgrG